MLGRQQDPERRYRSELRGRTVPGAPGDSDRRDNGERRDRPGHCGQPTRRAPDLCRRFYDCRSAAQRLVDHDAGVGDVVQPILRLAIQATNEQTAHLRRNRRGKRAPVDVRTQHCGEDVADRVPFEESLAAEHLEEDHAEGPDVGALVDRFAACLLRCHVGGGADDHPHLRRVLSKRRGVHGLVGAGFSRPAGLYRRHRFGETEVQHLHRAIGPHLDVGRLEIAMDDAQFVRRFKCVGNLLRDRQGFGDRDRAAIDQRREVLTLDQLHHQRPRSLRRAVPFEPVDVRDVRMVQRGECLRFAREAREAFAVGGKELGQDLDRDAAIELRVAGAIDLAHAARTECADDLIRSQPTAGRDHCLISINQTSASRVARSTIRVRPAPAR